MNEFRLIIQPDEDDAESAQVFVDGTVGGKCYRFLLDTGAARTSLILDDYTSTFESAAKHASSGLFATNSDDLIVVPNLEVGPIVRKSLSVCRVVDRPAAVSSLIGMDLLRELSCHFKFDENRVVVDFMPERNAFHDLYLDDRFHPYIDIQFGTTTAKAVWDTGASITVVDSQFVEKHPTFFRRVGESTGTDASGSQQTTPMYSMSDAVIGGYSFPPHKVAGVNLSHVNATLAIPMDLIVGYSTLRRANWLFDFPGKRWAIANLLDA